MGSGFARQTGVHPGRDNKTFRPWGFNYDRDYKMRLLEEYWISEWETVVEDFQEMKRLGANVVRVHLQFAEFMSGPGEPNETALAQLSKMLTLAEETGLYLDISGLACYRKPDVPAWYGALGEGERWNAQAEFWEAIARTRKQSPAVFCYDLMNEPVVPVKSRKQEGWLVAELLDFWYVQAISLDPAGRDRAEIARQWIDLLSKAIRKHDRRHLITVGMLPDSLEESGSGFVPSKVAPSLDFLSVHIYPTTETLEKDLQTLAGFQVGKPLIVEEVFPLHASLDELSEFMRRGNENVSGWIGFYWGQTPEELGRNREMSAAIIRAWLEFFQRNSPVHAPQKF